jgi:hypothetical protein
MWVWVWVCMWVRVWSVLRHSLTSLEGADAIVDEQGIGDHVERAPCPDATTVILVRHHVLEQCGHRLSVQGWAKAEATLQLTRLAVDSDVHQQTVLACVRGVAVKLDNRLRLQRLQPRVICPQDGGEAHG